VHERESLSHVRWKCEYHIVIEDLRLQVARRGRPVPTYHFDTYLHKEHWVLPMDNPAYGPNQCGFIGVKEKISSIIVSLCRIELLKPPK
jgi:hypothetical protein